jgi:triosephosphate isomerase
MKIVVANWKMYKTAEEARRFCHDLIGRRPFGEARQLWIAPPFLALPAAAEIAHGTPLVIGAQDMSGEREGPYTGEVSAEMIQASGGGFVILGHSERRRLFHETDEVIAKKLRRALEAKLRPLLCVGELAEEREKKKTAEVLRRQIEKAGEGTAASDLVIAYEPVWAIGTGKVASLEMIVEAHGICREVAASLWGKGVRTPILYGGSVNPKNGVELLGAKEIDGVLVGGASLELDSFLQIIQAVQR